MMQISSDPVTAAIREGIAFRTDSPPTDKSRSDPAANNAERDFSFTLSSHGSAAKLAFSAEGPVPCGAEKRALQRHRFQSYLTKPS
jgi:hypothetical protein